MFQKHQPKISAFARANPDNFAKVLRFVVLTIRRSLYHIPADLDEFENGIVNRGVLWGIKGQAFAVIDYEKESLFWQAEEIFYHAQNENEALEGLLSLFTSIAGFDLAKAGFACQLIYGIGACLDGHNIKRFSINYNSLRKIKQAKTLDTKYKKIKRYIDTCNRIGDSRYFWDSWCEYLAEQKPDIYKSPEDVSRLHCEAIGV